MLTKLAQLLFIEVCPFMADMIRVDFYVTVSGSAVNDYTPCFTGKS
jgi:hypothetical protein